MPTDRTQEVIKEIINNLNAVSDIPCANIECAYCDGKCARKICGGYMSENRRSHIN